MNSVNKPFCLHNTYVMYEFCLMYKYKYVLYMLNDPNLFASEPN